MGVVSIEKGATVAQAHEVLDAVKAKVEHVTEELLKNVNREKTLLEDKQKLDDAVKAQQNKVALDDKEAAEAKAKLDGDKTAVDEQKKQLEIEQHRMEELAKQETATARVTQIAKAKVETINKIVDDAKTTVSQEKKSLGELNANAQSVNVQAEKAEAEAKQAASTVGSAISSSGLPEIAAAAAAVKPITPQ